MAKPAQYDDGEQISCEPGYCGISPVVPAGMEEYLYSTEACYSLQDEINGTCEPPPDLPSEEEMLKELVATLPDTGAEQSCTAARDAKTQLRRAMQIEFIHFGKRDRFPAEAFEALAPKWREGLLREQQVLKVSLETELLCYREWLDLRNSLWGSLSRFTAWVKEIWQSDIEAVDTKEYEQLIKRTERVGANSLYSPEEIRYLDLREAGLEMMRIRDEQKKLSRRCASYREQIIEGAETSLAAAKTTEWIAFKFNDTAAKLAANISQPGNPLAEAAYRLTAVVVPKMVGRSVGEWTADIQGEKGVWWKEGTGRKVFKSISGVVVTDGASILSDLITGIWEKNLGKLDAREKELGKAVLRVLLEVSFTVLDAAIFDKAPAKLLEDLAWRTAKRLAADFLKVALVKEDKGMGAGMANVIEVLMDDIRYCSDQAKKTNQSFGDVAIEQVFFTIVRCAAGFAIGYMGQKDGSLDKWAKNQVASKQMAREIDSTAPDMSRSSQPPPSSNTISLAKPPQAPPPPVEIKLSAPPVIKVDVPVAKPSPKEIRQAPVVAVTKPTRDQKREQSAYWRSVEKRREVRIKAKAR